MKRKTKPPLERFERFFRRGSKNHCWNWKGGKHNFGYGLFWFSSRTIGAHVAAWRLYRGSTKGLHVLHECDNPSCVNPNHLKLGTAKDNMQDKVKRGRISYAAALLNEKQVREIRAAVPDIVGLSRKYKVTQGCINSVRSLRCWKHVT